MGYRIILLRNGEYKKTLYKSKTPESAIHHFERIIEENTKVKFPQRFLSKKKVLPVEYHIYLVKDHEEGDKLRFVRDKLGRLVQEKPLFDMWTALDDYPYELEESFYVYGYDPKTDRKDLRFIMALMMVGIKDQTLTKTIVVLHNKIIFYNEYQFDIVFCKCEEDAVRLYELLRKTARSNTFKRLIFMGRAGEKMTGELYEMMMEETGWDYRRVTRTATTT